MPAMRYRRLLGEASIQLYPSNLGPRDSRHHLRHPTLYVSCDSFLSRQISELSELPPASYRFPLGERPPEMRFVMWGSSPHLIIGSRPPPPVGLPNFQRVSHHSNHRIIGHVLKAHNPANSQYTYPQSVIAWASF